MASAAKRLEAVSGAAQPQVAFDAVTLELGGKTIIENLSLGVRPGEFLCIVGASGCGKTTALRLAAGLYQPTSGKREFRRPADARAAPRDRDRVPGLRQGAAAVAHRGGQRLAGAGSRRHAVGRAPCPHRGIAAHRRPARPRRQISVRNVRRHAAAPADRPLPGAGAEDAADGRAVRRARRDDAAGIAGRGAVAGGGQRRHRDLRDPRPRRSDLSRRPRHRPAAASRADRHRTCRSTCRARAISCRPASIRNSCGCGGNCSTSSRRPSSDGQFRQGAGAAARGAGGVRGLGARHPSAKRQPGAAERDRHGAVRRLRRSLDPGGDPRHAVFGLRRACRSAPSSALRSASPSAFPIPSTA